MSDTNISWTDKTWNCITGCTRVSPGCARCYAFDLHDMRHRAFLAGKKVPPQYAKPFKEVQLLPQRLTDPMGWKKPQRIFVNSMSDLFHDDVPDEYIDKVFAVMALAKQHTFQVLTKRADRMQQYIGCYGQHNRLELAADALLPGKGHPSFGGKHMLPKLPLPNVWLGISAENQEYADKRLPYLVNTPAAVRFVSYEPALGPLKLRAPYDGKVTRDWLGGERGISWVICGGESGSNRRPCEVEWFDDVADQCLKAGIACHIKQDSAARPGRQGRIPLELWKVKDFPKTKVSS